MYNLILDLVKEAIENGNSYLEEIRTIKDDLKMLVLIDKENHEDSFSVYLLSSSGLQEMK
jgi:hypothetical protein